ncbi:hypothetical protein ABZ942_28240 [Nocardia sp. NPDC046473]|uniref:hypothetical protein n=1 Tax=Nocardia sp. NPDC046473 TaxID=3155733 RepID=UPI0033E347BE
MTTVAIAVATVALCLAQLWGAMSIESLRYALYTLMLFSAVGLACLATGVAGALLYRTWRLSLIAPVAAILTFAVGCTGIPGEVGWALSKDAFEQAAATCAHTKETRLGIIRVTTITKRDGGCWLYTHGGLIDSTGFAYFPDRTPVSSSPKTSYTHLDGPWYRFYGGF